MSAKAKALPGAELAAREERIERRRRRCILVGLAGFFAVFLLDAWFAAFLYEIVPNFKVFSGFTFYEEVFWIGWWALTAAAVILALVAIGLGIAGLSREYRETRILAVVGIVLGVITLGVVAFTFWLLIQIARSLAAGLGAVSH